MNYLFDSGDTLPLHTRAANGYVSLLEPLLRTEGAEATARGPYFATLGQLPFDPDVQLMEDLGVDAFGALPACLVVIGDAEARSQSPVLVRWTLTVRVHLLAGFAGQLVTGRLDADVDDTRDDPGIRVMLDHVVELLHMQSVPTCPGSNGIQMDRIKHGATTPGWSWWYVSTQVDVQQVVKRNRSAGTTTAVQANHAVQKDGVILSQTRP